VHIEEQSFEAVPQAALFMPAGKMHRIDASPGKDPTYMVYAPGGPKQDLKIAGSYISSAGSSSPQKL
jgi:hypothetical protein